MRIGINTGGGDAPGLNAVIHAVVLAAHHRGWEVHGIQTGYAGLVDPARTIPLTLASVESIVDRGGTILGTTNRADPFHYPVRGPAGEMTFTDLSDEVVRNFRALKLDALVAVGGDGSMALAARFAAKGIPVIGVPKTIDNDLADTHHSFGFDTAVATATEAVDKLHSTASAHQRVFVVEVMGRYVGWIALHTGLTGSADVILLPEVPFELEHVAAKIQANERRGKSYGIIVAAEGARPVGGRLTTRAELTPGRQEPLLGGIAEWVAREVQQRTGKESRALVLGHLQRGGSPTPFDRLVALRYGAAAVRFLAEGKRNVLVAYHPPEMVAVPLEGAGSRRKAVPLDGDTIRTCRELGISLGDAAPLE
jgi:ATP-dependent phosphofructokinase / diphosphate-dependent phosphofructokinase